MKRQKKTTNGNPSLIRPHIYLGPELMIGPGKIALLKGVRETGSISAAARQMGMNYKRAWYLLDTLNQGFHQPVVEAVQGGREGGGTRLTQVKRYGLQLEVEAITYFLGRETLLATNKPGMAIWRERLFALMSRNAQSAMTDLQ